MALVLIGIPAHLVRSQQLLQQPAQHTQFQVIYYSGEELPAMQDAGGAQAGQSGAAGGRELHHPTQVIHVARANKLVEVVADAPQMKLSRTNDAVANLLSIPASDPGPPPASAVPAKVAPFGLVPQPAPVQPRPSVSREKLTRAPEMTSAAIQPSADAVRQVAGLRLPELGSTAVTPPPISVPTQPSVSAPKLTLPASVAVAPPPQVAREVSSDGVVGFGALKDVVPPPPQVVSKSLAANGNANGLGAISPISAPPQIGVASSSAHAVPNGVINALGSLVGAPAGPGKGGADSAAVIVSANPGTGVGLPKTGAPGALAMSSGGGSQPGAGGSGGGTGVGRGSGPGSGSAGTGPGSATAGSGFGAGAVQPGTSLVAGPGGSGTGARGGIPGVAIVGGTVIIPSFGAPAASAASTAAMAHLPKGDARRPAVTVIATPRSGGALNAMSFYGTFKSDKVYTIYIDTNVGTAVLQYAEHSNASEGFEADLTAPEPIMSEMPADLPKTRLLLACVLDKSGAVRNPNILQSGASEVAAKMVKAVLAWHFQPALRNAEPVAVDAILGFNIDTQ